MDKEQITQAYFALDVLANELKSDVDSCVIQIHPVIPNANVTVNQPQRNNKFVLVILLGLAVGLLGFWIHWSFIIFAALIVAIAIFSSIRNNGKKMNRTDVPGETFDIDDATSQMSQSAENIRVKWKSGTSIIKIRLDECISSMDVNSDVRNKLLEPIAAVGTVNFDLLEYISSIYRDSSPENVKIVFENFKTNLITAIEAAQENLRAKIKQVEHINLTR